MLIDRDENGIAHIVALSGGHDSTALAFLLKEREPRPYNYLCTPTGNELPPMFEHWNNLGEKLGKRLLPIMGGSLHDIIRQQKMLPNFRARFCTRILKIEPYRKFLFGECYHQRIGEWWEYWSNYPDKAWEAAALEVEMGGTFRTPGRDAWPSALKDLFSEFEKGRIPTVSLNRMKRERMNVGACRVCSM